MPLLFAPEGATNFSHAGHEFEVSEDGTVDVTDNVAADLRSHGFKDMTDDDIPDDATVSVKRSLVLDAMSLLGVAGNAKMRADKLVAAFEAAVAAKTEAATSLGKGGKPAEAPPVAAPAAATQGKANGDRPQLSLKGST